MEFCNKFVDKIQEFSKAKCTAVSEAKQVYNYLELSKENVFRNMMLSH